jgi:SAM-dependent methyltransferase
MDIDLVRRKYPRNAIACDLVERATARLRADAVQRLRLQPGDTVLDFGCGTGLSFALLVGAVGAEGRVVGVGISPDMLARARARVEAHGWLSVTSSRQTPRPPSPSCGRSRRAGHILDSATVDLRLGDRDALHLVFSATSAAGSARSCATQSWAPSRMAGR